MRKHPQDQDIHHKSIFDSVHALTNRTLENSKDVLKKAIIEKEKTIKRMYLNNLGIPKYLITEKPLSLKKMEKGLQNYFFGKQGQITNRFAYLKKEVQKDEMKKRVNLEKKIDTGPLTYYFLKENEDTFNKRVTEVKKHKLQISRNYFVKDDKDLNINLEQPTTRINEQLTSNTIDSNSSGIDSLTKLNMRRRSVIPCITSQMKKRILTPSQVEINNRKIRVIAMTPKRSRNIPNIPLLNTDSNNRQTSDNIKSLFATYKPQHQHQLQQQPTQYKHQHYPTQTDTDTITTKDDNLPYNSFQTELPRRKKKSNFGITRSLLLSKAKELGINQEQLEKKLFKLIDDANINRKNYQAKAKDQDLEEIFELKVKKKKRQGEAKEMFIQAIKLKDDYTLMDRNKAEMLKISDEITKMSDEAALLFAERIQDVYYRKSDNIEDNEYIKNPFIEKQKKLKFINLRNKVNQGFIKMKKMSFNLEFEKSNMKKKYLMKKESND